MEAAEFNELRPLFAPMLHTVSRKRCENQIIEMTFVQVCLVYSTSEYYNSPARIIILMTVLIDVLTDFVIKSFSRQSSLILDL